MDIWRREFLGVSMDGIKGIGIRNAMKYVAREGRIDNISGSKQA